MTGRNCVIIDKNNICCHGMQCRMANLDSTPGPNSECGQVPNLVPDDDEVEGGQVEGDLEGGQGVSEGGGQSSSTS